MINLSCSWVTEITMEDWHRITLKECYKTCKCCAHVLFLYTNKKRTNSPLLSSSAIFFSFKTKIWVSCNYNLCPWWFTPTGRCLLYFTYLWGMYSAPLRHSQSAPINRLSVQIIKILELVKLTVKKSFQFNNLNY